MEVDALFFSLIDGLFQDCGNSRTKHNSASWNPGKLLSMYLRRCLILTTFTFTSSHTSLIIPAYRVPLHQVQNTAVAGGMDPKRRFPLSGSSDEVKLLHVRILPLKLQYSTRCFQRKNLQCNTLPLCFQDPYSLTSGNGSSGSSGQLNRCKQRPA